MPLNRHQRLLYSDSYVCITPRNCCKILREPRFWYALAISLPCAGLACSLKAYQLLTPIDEQAQAIAKVLLNNNGAYSAIVFFLGFLMSFRVNSAYQRFWNGCDLVNTIAGDCFLGTSSIVSYCNCNKKSEKDVRDYQHLLIRLVSLLNALIFTELQQKCDRSMLRANAPEAYEFELLDVQGFDDENLDDLEKEQNKIEVAYQWLQSHLVIGCSKGMFSVAPPIIARAFQEFGTARARFHEAQKIAEFPFPFPYMAALQLLLITHWIITPIAAVQWTNYAIWAFVFAFLATFSIWFFVGVALDMEKPFGRTQNAVDVRLIQRTLNNRLLSLLATYWGERPGLKDSHPNDPDGVYFDRDCNIRLANFQLKSSANYDPEV
jgi:predicted membrane chloride channel (bestrophin family)